MTLLVFGLAGFATAALLVIALMTLVNSLWLPRLQPPATASTTPVSVLIPARNEAAVIGQTVQALLQQTHTAFELLLLDDNSTDGTAEVARAAAQGDSRLRIISGQPLPTGWLGKNWACQQLVEAAGSDHFLFTDADVRWRPAALAALLHHAETTRADLLTIWPTQETQTWAERLVVPLMSMVVLGYLPWLLVHHTPWSPFAAANGQCMLWRRRAYEAVGGHAAVRDNVLEDVTMARLAKAGGRRLRMADGNKQVACRMYTDWPTVKAGYAKNILAGYGNQPLFLVLGGLFHWLLFVLPWLWLALGWATPAWPLWPLLLIALGLAVRAVSAAVTHQRPHDALGMPLSVWLMTLIAVQSLWWHFRYGGPQWKGRQLARQNRSSPS